MQFEQTQDDGYGEKSMAQNKTLFSKTEKSEISLPVKEKKKTPVAKEEMDKIYPFSLLPASLDLS